MLLGCALLMALFLVWTKYKGDQARAVQKQNQSHVADSLARVSPSASSTGAVSIKTETPAAVLDAGKATPSETTGILRRRIRVVTPGFTAVLDNEGARIAA